MSVTTATAVSELGFAGQYERVPGVEQGLRPVYDNSAGKFLYFWSDLSTWLIGSDWSSGAWSLAAYTQDRSHCPSDSSGWQASSAVH